MPKRFQTFLRMLDRAKAVRGSALMGICNVTPDSFSDGGLYFAPEAARARVDELLAQGADVVDVGGESTWPGAASVPAETQIERVLEVVRYAAGKGTCVSIDTTNPAVAAACLDVGACAVNDVSCLRDGALAEVAASAGAALIVMHSRGSQGDMRGFSRYPEDAYGDVVRDVCAELAAAADRACSLGVPRDAIALDPGLGFAKSARHSTDLLARLHEIVCAVGAPVVVGASRKSFLTLVGDGAPPKDRLGASIAAALYAARTGAAMLRVHDVSATRQAVEFDRALRRAS